MSWANVAKRINGLGKRCKKYGEFVNVFINSLIKTYKQPKKQMSNYKFINLNLSVLI